MKSKLNNFNIGQAIKEIRVNLGLSQVVLSNKMKIEQTHLSSIERGITRITMSTILKSAKALDVPTKKILILASGIKKDSELIEAMFEYFK